MGAFTIDEAQLSDLQGKVVVLTGGASGIGLATTKLLLEKGAIVVAGDLAEPAEHIDSERLTLARTDVLKWDQLKQLFKLAVDQHGRIDHVFANAGVSGRSRLADETDVEDDGSPKQPDHTVVMVNFVAVMDTIKLAIHYLRKNPEGGSIVLAASSSSYQRFGVTDYADASNEKAAAKHGVLGLMRGLYRWLAPAIPVRVNCIAPSWTETGIVQAEVARRAGIRVQSPAAVARSVALLMADPGRNSQLIYSCQGQYTEFEQELLAASDDILQRAASVDPRVRSEEEEMMLYVEALHAAPS